MSAPRTLAAARPARRASRSASLPRSCIARRPPPPDSRPRMASAMGMVREERRGVPISSVGGEGRLPHSPHDQPETAHWVMPAMGAMRPSATSSRGKPIFMGRSIPSATAPNRCERAGRPPRQPSRRGGNSQDAQKRSRCEAAPERPHARRSLFWLTSRSPGISGIRSPRLWLRPRPRREACGRGAAVTSADGPFFSILLGETDPGGGVLSKVVGRSVRVGRGWRSSCPRGNATPHRVTHTPFTAGGPVCAV